ncbi:MAG: c-type cytochrome [Methyloversatilis discipulorum]|uniref:c-type cytochrome n=1 Tax=Methyloversatilis discipulorum TaxID=1119528 RepID=UPI0026ED3EDC|nr:c-type cytochrome [Methyloversatilis discipulorum]MBV5287950.1 c-type cytochrome [Methyloversatilis discipulorum]
MIRFPSFPALLALALTMVTASVGAATDAGHEFEQRVLACTGCHGAEGRAAADGYYPRIAGKPAGYLYNQLLNFRDGRRQYPLMSGLLQTLSDDYLREMASHFAALELPYPPPARSTQRAATLARGEALVRRGDATRDIPACESCHGSALTGVVPAIPGLLGLPHDYLAAQLAGWKSGIRQAHAPDCMAQIAQRMSADDIQAVAHWLSSQPVPQGGKPAARLDKPLPIRCGGVQEGAR